jgi:hypothetical protein
MATRREALTNTRDSRLVSRLKQELAHAERRLRERAELRARELAAEEEIAWREARDECHAFDRIRTLVWRRWDALSNGEKEIFLGERRLAEMALRDADRADASFTVVSFAKLSDRLQFLRGGTEREKTVTRALERGGVSTEAFGGRHFQRIVR